MEKQEGQVSEQTVNLMSLLFNDEWLREAIRIEDEADCDVEAGLDWGADLGAFLTNPRGYSRFAQLRLLVMRAFAELLPEWNLGVGAQAAQLCGQQLLLKRLKHPTLEVQERLIAVIEEELAHPQFESDSKSVRSDLQELLRQVLTPEDWELIAASAGNCVREHLIERVQLAKTA